MSVSEATAVGAMQGLVKDVKTLCEDFLAAHGHELRYSHTESLKDILDICDEETYQLQHEEE